MKRYKASRSSTAATHRKGVVWWVCKGFQRMKTFPSNYCCIDLRLQQKEVIESRTREREMGFKDSCRVDGRRGQDRIGIMGMGWKNRWRKKVIWSKKTLHSGYSLLYTLLAHQAAGANGANDRKFPLPMRQSPRVCKWAKIERLSKISHHLSKWLRREVVPKYILIVSTRYTEVQPCYLPALCM